MAELNYKFSGENTRQLADEVERLRQNFATFRALESAAFLKACKLLSSVFRA
jgi:hypothetical protein